jgi:hypothetical protein
LIAAAARHCARRRGGVARDRFIDATQSPEERLAFGIPASIGLPGIIRQIVAKYLLQQVFYQQFSQLHSIERGAFAYVI